MPINVSPFSHSGSFGLLFSSLNVTTIFRFCFAPFIRFQGSGYGNREAFFRRVLHIVWAFGILFLSGCVSTPSTIPLSVDEAALAKESFRQMVALQRQCNRYLDVSVTVTVKSFLFSGSMNGYLQSMSPSYIKFVGINPFGQPQVIFTTDGEFFRFIEVAAAKGFEGLVDSRVYNKYAPAGFDHQFSYYWLIGRLQPGNVKIVDIVRGKDGDGFWVKLCCGEGNSIHKVLFDPQKMIVHRHMLVDESGDTLLDVRYERFSQDGCMLPGKISISSGNHNGAFEVKMSDWNMSASLSASDFDFSLPSGFTSVVVE